MTLNDVVALSKAGFTREEIMKFHTTQAEPKQQEPEKKEQPKQQEPTAQVAGSDIEKKMNDFLDKLLKMNFLTENKMISDVDNKSYDFFASVIDPTYSAKKE